MYKGEGMKINAISFKGAEGTVAKSGEIFSVKTPPSVDIKRMKQIALIKSEELADAFILPRRDGHWVTLIGKDGLTIRSNPKFVCTEFVKDGKPFSWLAANHPKQYSDVSSAMIGLHTQLLAKAQEFLSHCRK